MKTFITEDGLELAYYVDDFTDPWHKPETVLLLHAAMGNSQRWYQWVPHIAQKYKVIRLDLRGHGASQKPDPAHEITLSKLVADVISLLNLVGVEKAHIVGNSAGGYIAQQLAINHSDRVKTLALFGSTPGLKHSPAKTWLPEIQKVGLKKFLAETISERFDANADPQLVSWFIEQAGSNDPEFIGQFISHMCTHDFMDDLPRIKCPTLIVAAANGAIGHIEIYETMSKKIAHSESKYYDTSGHSICDSYALKCVQDLMSFLDRRGI